MYIQNDMIFCACTHGCVYVYGCARWASCAR